MRRTPRNAMPPALFLLNIINVVARNLSGTTPDDALKIKKLEKLDHDIAGVDARRKMTNENKVVVMLRAEKLAADIEFRKLQIEQTKRDMGMITPSNEFHPTDYNPN